MIIIINKNLVLWINMEILILIILINPMLIQLKNTKHGIPNEFVTDGSGNTATAIQNVTVTDNVLPTITAPLDVTVCNGAAIVLGTPTTADNCGVASTTNNAPGSYSTGTTVVTWTVTDNSGNTATATQNVTVNALPVGSASNIVICNGDVSNVPLSSTITGTTFTWTSAVTVGSVIGEQDCSSGCGTNIADILTNLGFVHGVVEYTITPTSPLGCVGAPFTADVTVGAAPATPVISGPSVVCGLTTAIYTVAVVPEATTYTWTVPTGVTGMTITSGQGTTALHVTISAGTVVGNVTCTASNNCLPSNAAASMAVTKKPSVPGAITGPTSVCGLTTATYSIANVFGATSYGWTLPTGMTITGGTGTTQITVSISTSFINGNVTVSAINACGNIPGISINVTGNVPIAPVAITGVTNVCQVTSATYSVGAVAGATGYSWTAVGTGMSISGSSTGLSVTVLMNGTNGGTISCKATNICGQGPARTLAVVTTAVEPGAITGPANVCGMTTATYSVAAVAGTVTYNWIAPPGITITSGQGTTAIVVSIPAQTGTTTQTNALKVTSTNACGSVSAIRSMNVTRCLDAIAMNTPVAEQSNNFSNIYPNPTSSEFTIDVTTDVDKDVIVEVYDILGNLLIQQKHQAVIGVNTMKTNIEEYRDGMYFVRLLDSNSNVLYTQRLIKQ